ncbi:hypothetical protein ACFL1H_04150 [Nanoarchaeota archaeon]
MANKIENKIKKILIVNDDREDIIDMKRKLPRNLKIEGGSQFNIANNFEDYKEKFDLIILDNDANDRKESKGKDTLQIIRNNDVDVPVVYTSFTPAWVDESVYQTKNVDVVRTDLALEKIAKLYDLKLRDIKKIEKDIGQVSIILTYNSVDKYRMGVHEGNGNGKLLIASYEKKAGRRAKEVLAKHLDKIYNGFEWRMDRDLIRNVFVYDGVNGGDVPGQVGQCLGHDIRLEVNMITCGCDWDRKQRYASANYVNMYKAECGGERTLALIADVILGVKKPGINYEDRLSIPLENITAQAERFY